MSSTPDPAASDPAAPGSSAPDPAAGSPPAEAIRSGSPFAANPPPYTAATSAGPNAEVASEASVAAEMARGGILAGWLMVPFAFASVWGFPLGSLLISGLGSLLSLFGCTAPQVRWAIAALLLHFTLVAVAVLRWFDGSP